MSKHPLYNETGLQRNNKSHVLYALADKKIELQNLESEYKAKLIKLKSDVLALETTICLFDGNCNETLNKINSIKPRAKTSRHHYFKNGEGMRLVLETLRLADEPLTATEIIDTVAKKKGLEFSCSEERYSFSQSISVQLNAISKKGIIMKVGGDKGVGIWGIVA